MLGLKRGIVKLASNHEKWGELFENERKSLRKMLDDEVLVEHVGSTSISGVIAKPIIDIIIGYPDNALKEKTFKALGQMGYEDRGEQNIPGQQRLFVKGPEHNRKFYIHVLNKNHERWNSYLLFRDFLRQNKDARDAYNALKKELIKKYADNREQYTKGKEEFINDITTKAKKLS